LVHGENVLVGPGRDKAGLVEGAPTTARPALQALLGAGGVHEDAAHGLARSGEEVAAAVPPRLRRGAHQTQVRLMDQGRRFERWTGLLLRQSRRRELAQLVVDQRQELGGGGRVALLDGGQDTCDLAHEVEASPGRGREAPLSVYQFNVYPSRSRWT